MVANLASSAGGHTEIAATNLAVRTVGDAGVLLRIALLALATERTNIATADFLAKTGINTGSIRADFAFGAFGDTDATATLLPFWAVRDASTQERIATLAGRAIDALTTAAHSVLLASTDAGAAIAFLTSVLLVASRLANVVLITEEATLSVAEIAAGSVRLALFAGRSARIHTTIDF